MKPTIILVSLLLLFTLSSCLRVRSKSRAVAEETTQESLLRKKFKADPAPAAAATATATATTANAAAPAAAPAATSPAASGGSAKKTDTSGAGPVDSNAATTGATGIETNETAPPVVRCTQSIGVDGFRIKDLYNYCQREPAHLKMNIWNVNIFEKKDAATLVNSAEWTTLEYPVKNITGAPECLLFKTQLETDHDFAFCWPQEADLDKWYDAILAFKLCREGVVPSKGSARPCTGAGPAMANYTDPLTGRVISVEDASATRLGGGGGGRGGCVNCGK